jgi:hypothetical protein
MADFLSSVCFDMAVENCWIPGVIADTVVPDWEGLEMRKYNAKGSCDMIINDRVIGYARGKFI